MAELLLPPSPRVNVPDPYSKDDLLEVLVHWHRASASEIPKPFPGPLVGKDELSAWVYTVRKRAEERNIPRQQWANALLAWIPAAPEGKSGFKEHLLKCMREMREAGLWEKGRFWKWEEFKHLFFELHAKGTTEYRLKIGAAAVGSAVALPVIGIPLLGAMGFTSTGIASGSVAASLHSAVYGSAARGIFTTLQSIGVRAAFPTTYNFVAGAIGAGATAVAAADHEDANDRDHDLDEFLGDIGDDDS